MNRRLMLDTDIFSYIVNDRYAGLRERFMRDVEAICALLKSAGVED